MTFIKIHKSYRSKTKVKDRKIKLIINISYNSKLCRKSRKNENLREIETKEEEDTVKKNFSCTEEGVHQSSLSQLPSKRSLKVFTIKSEEAWQESKQEEPQQVSQKYKCEKRCYEEEFDNRKFKKIKLEEIDEIESELLRRKKKSTIDIVLDSILESVVSVGENRIKENIVHSTIESILTSSIVAGDDKMKRILTPEELQRQVNSYNYYEEEEAGEEKEEKEEGEKEKEEEKEEE